MAGRIARTTKSRIPKSTSGHLGRSIFFWCPEVRLEFSFWTPRWNARPREGERRCLWSPRLLGGLAGGRVRSRKSRGIPKKRSSSRHSFPGSRVIQAQGKFDSKGLVKNWCKWITKMKISQNLCVQLTPEQFSPLREVKTYPGMWSLCLSMRFRKICTEECVRGMGQTIEIFMKFRHFRETRKWMDFSIRYI